MKVSVASVASAAKEALMLICIELAEMLAYLFDREEWIKKLVMSDLLTERQRIRGEKRAS